METKLLTAHLSILIFPYSCLLISSQKSELLTFPQSCQPFPQQGTRSHFLHFQGELVKPLSSTLLPSLALTIAAP